MSREADFLTGLAQVISALSLYEEGHPARERAIDRAHEQLLLLHEDAPGATFTFVGDEIVYRNRPMRDLRNWNWGARLANAGVQRLEFLGPVERGDFEAFAEEVYQRISGEPIASAEIRQGRPSNIRYGLVGVRGDSSSPEAAAEAVTASLGFSLREEIDAVEWMHQELKENRQLRMLEAESIVRSLSVAMHGDQAYLVPLLRLKEFDQYTVTHTMNVSVLTMSLAEFLGLSPREVRMFGISGLLHDLGKVKIPDEILNKPGKLDDAERAVMNNHTIEGARIIMETEEHLDMAAVVAYEHHIKIDGGGYPSLQYPRTCHQASNLVHVCDVFDALRTHRPYREAWPTERALSIIEEGAGPEFDRDIAHAFITMIRRYEGRIADVDPDDPEVRLGPAEGASDAATEEPGSGG